jgi:hypothetical protein
VGHVVEDVERLAMRGQFPLLEGDDTHVTGDTWIAASTVMRLTMADAIDKYGAPQTRPDHGIQLAAAARLVDVLRATAGTIRGVLG